jgi:hypothetical protein
MDSEKSIIKTLQSQQKQFMEEKRRRAERNENILRTLDRIDYQAQMLASKTERLRALKVNKKFTLVIYVNGDFIYAFHPFVAHK